MLTPTQLSKINRQALSLQERFSLCSGPGDSTSKEDDEKYSTYIKTWSEISSDGDQELFERRLALSGLSLEALPSIFSETEVSVASESEWTEMLVKILEAVGNADSESLLQKTRSCDFVVDDAPLPFQDLFVPIVQFARATAQETLSTNDSLVLDTADSDLDRLLLSRLSETCCRVLEVEFNTFLAMLQLEGLDYREIIKNPDSTKNYELFVGRLFEGGLEALCIEYPVFARQLVHRIEQWIEVTTEFHERLANDISELRTQLGVPEASRVARLKPGLSDPHDNGRTVIVTEFDTGHKLVYKPKDLGPDAGYFELAGWLNNKGAPHPFKLLHVVNRSDYGWIEFAQYEPINHEEGAARFYLRSGSLLALLYALDGLDFHHENVIACGEYPTPIDFETIVQHSAKLSSEEEEMTSAAQEAIRRSVLKTHFLPQLYKIRGKYIDISGMGAQSNKEVSMEVLKWSNLNTDAMGYRIEKISPSFDSEHAPKIGDEFLTPEDYADEVIQGFSDTYRFIAEIEDEILEDDAPFPALFRQPVRFLNRATQFYGSVLNRIAHPSFQRNGIDLGIELEVLYRSALSKGELSPLHPLIATEISELNRLDIPKFMARADSDGITLSDGQQVPSCFNGSPLDVASQKLRDFCEEDLSFQTELIRSSLSVRRTLEVRENLGRFDEKELLQDHRLGRSEMIEIATDIANEIQNQAKMSRKMEPSWVTISPSEDEKQFYLDDMKYDVYQGNLGVGIFFAGMEKLMPGNGYGDFAYSAIGMSRRWIQKARPLDIEMIGIGGFSGVGSMIYGLTAIASILDDRLLLDEATLCAELITEKLVYEDNTLDILSGAAGTASALLTLFRATGNQQILEKASLCGSHLVAKRRDLGNGMVAWAADDTSPLLTGFSHGAAGIAFALFSLYRETGASDLYDAAEGAIAFEDTQYDSDIGNWKDNRAAPGELPPEDNNALMWGWCNGAPGIALSRIGTLDVYDNRSVRNQIEMSLDSTSAVDHLRSDHLCCGNASISEVLLSAGALHQRHDWQEAALGFTAHSVARHTKDGRFIPHSVFNDLFNPSLFQGSSGFGYHLLRLLEPVDLPNILLHE
jgi:type 2 lantibiotic biosynthesis protein LanM